MKRRKKDKNRGGSPKWLSTYSDMITLILVFFILLFSMSSIDAQRFEAVSQSFQNRAIFDFLPSAIPFEHQTNEDHPDEVEIPAGNKENKNKDTEKEINESDKEESLDGLLDDVESFLDSNQLNNVITANRSEEGVVLVLQESILFETGEADILDSAVPFLNHVGQFLEKMPNKVRVEGHTDSRPITSYRYPSNWELSAARAGTVIRYLTNEFDLQHDRFFTVGYADTRPIVPNTSEQNWGKNRRVEIVILKTDGEEKREQGVG